MNDREIIKNTLEFITLNSANEVPPNVSGQFFKFLQKFLKSAFPEVAVTRVVQFPYVLSRFAFADGNQRHTTRVTSRLRANKIYVFANFPIVFRNLVHWSQQPFDGIQIEPVY